ncbi:hypothetical protein [Agarivorans sp. DSG3-1]|uniref:hypothetical protein n=1 Tax=Agarivorans sp. DSG3-1 TaxID=3342249 RepID=UPI00398E8C93
MRILSVAFGLLLLVACSSTPTWDGMSESEIAAWKEIGVNVEQVQTYVRAGMSQPQVKEFIDQKFTDPAQITSWGQTFTAFDARGWIDSGFDLTAAKDWAANKFSFEEAAAWASADFDLDGAKKNRDKGLTPVK